ncbi:MAG TPA: nif-specific transcriptional activator NifA [Burkholderiales bacterium]|nr:nif-specific transcriptional activator NifA [Burkholderiales bacterium]
MDMPVGKFADLELVTVYEISKLLSSSLDFESSVRGVLKLLLTNLQMHRGVASMVQDSGRLHIVGAVGISPEQAGTIHYSVGEGVTGRVLKSGSPVVVQDISREPLFENRLGREAADLEGVSFVAVPIRAGNERLGVLSVDRRAGSTRPINFERDVRILTLVANLIGQTWKLHRSVAADREALLEEKQRLQKQLQGKHHVRNVIGDSKRMQQVFAEVHQAAAGNATVLLRGESGTGKEAIAHAIHYLSRRKDGPFIKVNCAALPETLLESELFGHEKGAFTGATAERKGRVESASGGTLFLDEIGDISAPFQAKLLRVLQEKEFERVGGNKTLKADFRLVTATNRNLEDMVRKGQFRADLYFRINVVTIFLPPLRERREDIPRLVEHFVERFNRDNGRRLSIAPECLPMLSRCNWPGNVRELENCIERTATMTRGSVIRPEALRCQQGQCFSSVLLDSALHRACVPIVEVPGPARRAPAADEPPRDAAQPGAPVSAAGPAEAEAAPEEDIGERERIIAALEKCGWVQAKAARMLNLTPRQMGYAIRKYNIPLRRL